MDRLKPAYIIAEDECVAGPSSPATVNPWPAPTTRSGRRVQYPEFFNAYKINESKMGANLIFLIHFLNYDALYCTEKLLTLKNILRTFCNYSIYIFFRLSCFLVKQSQCLICTTREPQAQQWLASKLRFRQHTENVILFPIS